MEDSNTSDVIQLDEDVRLPPRKRLLAGLRRQNSESPPPLPLFSTIPSHISKRLRNMFISYDHLSPEELVEASHLAALAAYEAAADAKALAEDKAAKAAKARAFAKSALELVVASKKYDRKDAPLKRGRPKKHVTVKNLYKKRKLAEKNETDEEVARRLHRAMNSSSRLSKSPTSSSAKLQKYMKIRKQLALGKTRFSPGGLSLGMPFASEKTAEVEAGDVVQGQSHNKSSEHAEMNSSETGGFPANGDAEVYMMVRAFEDKLRTTRKRGRIKQKKLSLSLCTIRDLKNSKEEPVQKGLPSVEEPKGDCATSDMPASSVFPSSDSEMAVETLSTWKFKDFSAPQCYAGTNILRSLCSNLTITTGSAAMVEVDQ